MSNISGNMLRGDQPIFSHKDIHKVLMRSGVEERDRYSGKKALTFVAFIFAFMDTTNTLKQ